MLSNSVESILEVATDKGPNTLISDSIQTLTSQGSDSAAGSVGQVKESASQLVRFAKSTGTTIIMIGHVTKEGVLAGPRVLEHMVDTVLYFESNANSRLRMIRSVKNRYGLFMSWVSFYGSARFT